MKEIQGQAKTIRKPLNGAKYSIDYHQREVKWQNKQLREPVFDGSGGAMNENESSLDFRRLPGFPLPHLCQSVVSLFKSYGI